jgi:hypothetical protein
MGNTANCKLLINKANGRVVPDLGELIQPGWDSFRVEAIPESSKSTCSRAVAATPSAQSRIFRLALKRVRDARLDEERWLRKQLDGLGAKGGGGVRACRATRRAVCARLAGASLEEQRR